MSDLVIANTVPEISGVLAEHPAVLVEFGAVWCMPCKAFEPHFRRFAAKHENIVCVKVDVDVDPAVVSEYKLQSVPQVMWFVNGEYVRTLPPTARTVQKLENELDI